MFAGQDRYKWIEDQYQKYRRRQYMALWLIAIGMGVIAIAALIPTAWLNQLPILIRQAIGYSLIISFAGCFMGGFELFTSAEKLLPPVEDRALYYLRQATVNLKAFASNGDQRYKDKSLKALTELADRLDDWTWGNLKFLQESAGKKIIELRKNFRGRLIPAVSAADKTKVQSLIMLLSQNMENPLELGQLDTARIELWNNSLSRLDYHEPRPSRIKRLGLKRFHLSVILLALAAPVATGLLAFHVVHTSVDTAYQSAATVLTGMIVLMVFLFGRQKRS